MVVHWFRRICGGRIIKTGISVFITASICLYFQLPVIFAVITAIVTIEPTTSDSIKKAFVRFPASAIGAAVSLTLTSLYGHTSVTYALSAALTILLCSKLHLDDGILVATLTAIAMIPQTEDHFLTAFITRIGTTTIGIVISTMVNLLIFPPKYSPMIIEKLSGLYLLAGEVLEKTINEHLNQQSKPSNTSHLVFKEFNKSLEKSFQLSEYERSEFKFHKIKASDFRNFQTALKELSLLQQVAFHLGNLQYVQLQQANMSIEDRELIKNVVASMIQIFKDSTHSIPKDHFLLIEKLNNQFWDWKTEARYQSLKANHHHFTPLAILAYELLSLHDVLEELEIITVTERRVYQQGITDQVK